MKKSVEQCSGADPIDGIDRRAGLMLPTSFFFTTHPPEAAEAGYCIR